MPDKIYYLGTCDTCRKILKEIGADKHEFVMQDIKTEPMTAAQLEGLKKQAGSYEAIFSKRAVLYKELGLASQSLTEKDYKKYLLEHYTFLKRPVIEFKGQLFVGNDKKTVEAAKQALVKG